MHFVLVYNNALKLFLGKYFVNNMSGNMASEQIFVSDKSHDVALQIQRHSGLLHPGVHECPIASFVNIILVFRIINPPPPKHIRQTFFNISRTHAAGFIVVYSCVARQVRMFLIIVSVNKRKRSGQH